MNKKYKKHLLLLFGASLLIPLFMLIIKRFPSSDFWWYHAKNWYLLKYLLPSGKIIGWNPFWHLGYPILQMYGLGAHLLVLFLIKIFGFSLISSELLINSLAYILLIISFFIFLVKYVNFKLAYISAFLLIIFPRLFNEVFIQGHYTNLLALSFGLIGLSFLDTRSIVRKILFILFMTLSLITHHSFFIILATAIILTTFFTQDKKVIFRTILKLILPIILISFWLIPAIIESKYWGVKSLSPNPLVLYLLSYGPFLIICFIGIASLFVKKRFKWIVFFISSLFFLSLASRYIFPHLLWFISNLLNKIFVETFKSTVVGSIFLIVGLAYVIIKCTESKKWKYLGAIILIGYILFSFFLINLYIKQDTTKLIFRDDDVFKKDSYNELYIKNFDKLKGLIEINSLDNRYSISSMIGVRLFKVPAVQGVPAPMPRRYSLLDKDMENKFFRFSGTKLFISEEIDKKDSLPLGDYTYYYFDFNLDLFKEIIKNKNLLNYLKHPEEFPSRIENGTLYIYKIRNPEEVIEISKFRPIAYIAKKELWDNSLVEEEKYRIPITHFKKDKNIDPYFLKVSNKGDIKFIPLELNTKIDSKIEIEKINIFTEKINEYIPVYIKINYSPHWKAYIEKEEIPVYNIFPDFMLILVPPGTEKVELIWEKTIYDYIGLIFSLLGLLLVVFWIKKA